MKLVVYGINDVNSATPEDRQRARESWDRYTRYAMDANYHACVHLIGDWLAGGLIPLSIRKTVRTMTEA